jgi:hypothetical protein
MSLISASFWHVAGTGAFAGERTRAHVSKRFKKLAAQAGVPVVTLHEGGGTPATR